MIRVEKFIPGGQTLGVDENGKKIFFWGALPGELVAEYQITKNKSHYTEAIAIRILDPSPFRVKPEDSCYLATSPWQIIDYHQELLEKQSLVQEIFHEHQIPVDLPEIFTDHHPYCYRNKMEYALYYNCDTSKIDLAFHVRGSHRKIPIAKSSIERPELFDAASNIIAELNYRHEEARKYQSILLRTNQSGKVSGGLYENHQPHPIFPELTDTILGHNYSYSPNGFFQINLPVYEMALNSIKSHITTNQVLDLYAGVGTIGLSVAADRDLTLVEVDKSAFRELEKNATHTAAASHPTTILARSEEVLDLISSNATVILDPPRAGCDPKLLDKILAVTPPVLIYLSCNPATQARDLKILLKTYHLQTIETYNFFPRTPHIENLAILTL